MDQTQQMNSPSAPIILNISVGNAGPPVAAANNSQVPVENPEVPVENSEMGYENSEVPADNSEMGYENSQLPADNSEMGYENSQLPADNSEVPEEPSLMNSFIDTVESVRDSVTDTISSTMSPEETNEGEEYIEEGEENSEIPLENSQVQPVEEQPINREADKAAVIAALERRIQTLEESINSASDAAKRATDAANRAEDAANRAEQGARQSVVEAEASNPLDLMQTNESLSAEASNPLDLMQTNEPSDQFQNNADSVLSAEASNPVTERQGKVLTELEVQRQGLRGQETEHLKSVFEERFSWIPEKDRPKVMQADIAKLTASPLRSSDNNDPDEADEKERLKQSIIESSLLNAARRYVVKVYNKEHPKKKLGDPSMITDHMLHPLITSPEDAEYSLEKLLSSLEKKTFSVRSVRESRLNFPTVSYMRSRTPRSSSKTYKKRGSSSKHRNTKKNR